MKNRNYNIFIIVYLFILLISFDSNAIQMIKIAIGLESDQAIIQGNNLVLTTNNKILFTSKNIIKLNINNNGIIFNKKNLGIKKITIASSNPILYKKQAYHRKIEINWKNINKKAQLLIIHHTPLEHYILGTVASEMPTSWPLEALKAQAIAVRTYALEKKYKNLNKTYHIKNTVLHQVYSGINHINKKVGKAVKLTKGQVIVSKNALIQAIFHSTCGDKTENSQDVWGGYLSYLNSSNCGYCKSSTTYRWERNFDLSILKRNTINSIGNIIDIKIIKKTKSGRSKRIMIIGTNGKQIINSNKFRSFLGFNNIPSTWFNSIFIKSHRLYIKGKGFGHGVGLCQWGAYGMAKQGYNATEIISYYYTDTEIRYMY